MKRTIAGFITVAVLGFVVMRAFRESPTDIAPGASSSTEQKTDSDSPEECVHRMFAAAEQGDVATYLDCFTGPERQRLERELADQSREVYATSLRDALRELKGRAIFAPEEQETTDNEVLLTVERVYATRTERQTYQLVRESDQWRISAVETARAYQPTKAYGTPVFEMPQDDTQQP